MNAPLPVVIPCQDLAAGPRALRRPNPDAKGLGEGSELPSLPWFSELRPDVDWCEAAASDAIIAEILSNTTSRTGPLHPGPGNRQSLGDGKRPRRQNFSNPLHVKAKVETFAFQFSEFPVSPSIIRRGSYEQEYQSMAPPS